MERSESLPLDPSKPVRDYSAAELDALLGEFLQKPAAQFAAPAEDPCITVTEEARVEELLRSIPELPGEDEPVVS